MCNGNVISLDDAHPTAQAVAIADGRIQAVGSDAQIDALAGPRTELVDLGGRTLMPGFCDAHAHVSQLGHELAKADLSRCACACTR